MMECVLCNEDIPVQASGWELGNNAEPVVAGRCCDDCNWAYVIPTRVNGTAYTHWVDPENEAEMKASDKIRNQRNMVPGRNNMGNEEIGAGDIRKIVDDDLLKLPDNMTEEEAKHYDKMFKNVNQLTFANSGWEADGEE